MHRSSSNAAMDIVVNRVLLQLSSRPVTEASLSDDTCIAFDVPLAAG